MSRAYCLTCNEHVHETPSGTCPLGHPVAADGFGPEPWVGFAGDTETHAAEVPMQHLGSDGLPREHASVGTPYLNGSVNGSGNGSSNGHAGSLAASSVAFPSVNGNDGPGSNDLASDDLTALLAEALREHAPEEHPTTPMDEPTSPPDEAFPPVDEAVAAPVDEAVAPVDEASPPPNAGPAAAPDEADWSELASLAAELHLDEHVATDDGPSAPPPPAEPPPHTPADSAPEGDLSASSIDDLLAELAGGTTDSAPPVDDAPVEPSHAPEPPVGESWPDPADDIAAWDTPAPAPPVAPTEDAPSWDAPPPSDDVGSVPEADLDDIWAEPDAAPVEEPTPAPTVDLYNFTARGKRVGDAGSALPAKKKKRGRKR